MNSRIVKLAKTIVNYSCEIKKGQKVTIDVLGDSPRPLIKALIKEISNVGGQAHIILKDAEIMREQLLIMTADIAKNLAEHDLNRLRDTDVYIMIKAPNNTSELSDVPEEQMGYYSKYYSKPVNEHILGRTRWLSIRYPSYAMAQMAHMSFDAFETMYFDVCTLDYSKLSSAMDHLVDLMKNTDKVRIVGPDTDIEFSIKDIPVHKCAGKINLPDGEVYTAPVKDSVNGYIKYNVPSLYHGVQFDDVRLEFENGKIVKATSNQTDKMNKVFDTDDGARYIGEFAIGVNPFVLNPINDILFDEKIMGSFHLTPGFSYENASNGNHSAVHWDLICIQTKEQGGGEIYFDDVLIRKDGYFVVESLQVLNPDMLIR